jgi:hypothetical protein
MNQSISKHTLAALGLVTLAAMIAPPATAACLNTGRGKPPLGQQSLLRPASFIQQSEQDNDADRDSGHDSIVGFWHVKFVSKNSHGIPDGIEIDAGYQQWHSDGTEILFSAGRKPMDGDVCFGVWKKIGPQQFKLNHFAAPWDAAQTQLIGPTNFLVDVTLDRKGNKFTGPFVINSYDESGNLLSQVRGTVTGTRIEVDTPPERIF